MKDTRINRREFIKLTGVGIGGKIILPGCVQSISKWRFFSDDEAIVVEAISEQIIPTDHDLGEKEANVINLHKPYFKLKGGIYEQPKSITKTM